MRFFVAEDAPQNDGGFLGWLEPRLSRSKRDLVVWVAWASLEKRWQSHRTPKVLGGAFIAEVWLVRRRLALVPV
jgi:hypothetical protein